MHNHYSYPVFVFFASSWLVKIIEAANVLCMFTSSHKSQLLIFMAVANTLIDRNHNVTVVTTIPIPPQAASQQPFRHILLQQPNETLTKLQDNIAEMSTVQASKVQSMMNFMVVANMLPTMQRDALKQVKFKDFLKEDNHFDLMLLGYFNNDFVLGVAGRYRCPIAVVSLGGPYGPISRMIGNPEETSYVQFPLFGKSQQMSFRERLVNFLWAVVEPALQIYANFVMEQYYKSIFPKDFYPKFSDVITNISLVLCNNHFSEMPVRPLVPAVVEIGGIHMRDTPDPLPKDIQELLDSSENGTVLFNVGTRERRNVLKPETINIVIQSLSKLDQSVLWQWEYATDPPRIPNILFKRWLPIDDILFHPNLSLFITDGRPSAIRSAQLRGVPMVGLPQLADEPFNIEEMTSKGFGVSVDANSLTEDALTAAIAKVLDNRNFRQKIKDFSRIYGDRPLTAKETAAFWLEYVIRHRGAFHMQSPLVNMDIFQRWNIDVIAAVLFALYVFKVLNNTVVIFAQRCLKLRVELYKRPVKYKFVFK